MIITMVVDDLRDIPCDIMCRTYGEAECMVSFHIGLFDKLYLDHDLGHPDDSCTGYKIISMMEELCYEQSDLWPKEIVVVTSNPAGRDNIERVLKKHYVLVGVEFKKKLYSQVTVNGCLTDIGWRHWTLKVECDE